MKQLGRVFLVAAVLFGTTTSPVANAVEFIQPTVNIALPQINFGAGISPVIGGYSNDALNILRAHQVALQQVQAAIMYLQANRSNILAGENAAYNAAFGDFYDPNSQFAGQYVRTFTRQTGVNKSGKATYTTYYNTAHFDRVLYVYTQIQSSLQQAVTYDLGAQLTLAANGTVIPNASFDAYRNQVLIAGDPRFGNSTGLLAAPVVLNSDRGELQWGHSTSFSKRHLNQLATAPGNPLNWDDDNDISTPTRPLTPAEELAFFRDRLDAYAVAGSRTIFVGGAFLNEEQRSNSTPDGTPNPYFHPTELEQYQMIIAALAETDGSLTTSGTAGTQIMAGLLAAFGETSGFYAALDSGSYAAFADALKPMQDGGIGDGTLLPPPRKHGTDRNNFIPIVPGS